MQTKLQHKICMFTAQGLGRSIHFHMDTAGCAMSKDEFEGELWATSIMKEVRHGNWFEGKTEIWGRGVGSGSMPPPPHPPCNHCLTPAHTPLLSHLNWRLGPATYAIKIKNCNIMKLCDDVFRVSFPYKLYFRLNGSSSFIKWSSSYWRVCHCSGLCSSFFFFYVF